MLYTRHGAGWGVCGACASGWLEFTPEAPTYDQAGRIVVNVTHELGTVAREIIGDLKRNSLVLLACPTTLLGYLEEHWHVDGELPYALLQEAGPAFSRSRPGRRCALAGIDPRLARDVDRLGDATTSSCAFPIPMLRNPTSPPLPSPPLSGFVDSVGLACALIDRPIPRGLAYRLDELYWTVRSEEQVCQQDNCGLPTDAAM